MMETKKYDIAAYVWPSYTGDEPRTRMFWEEGIGEWQSVKNSTVKSNGYNWGRKPLWGYVNEADPYIMEMEINAAADHGVNVFIYDWYWYDRRPFLENCLNDGFLKAKNNSRMKFYIMWANHDATNLWDIRNSSDGGNVIWQGGADRKEFDIAARRIIDKYFSHPSYYKINGCPVFMIYDVNNLIRGLGGMTETLRAIESFREMTVKAGFSGLELQMTYWNKNTVRVPEIFKAFNSMSHYQYVHFTNIDRDYNDILSDVKREWERIDSEKLPTYYPHVSIGWDNNPRYRDFRAGIVKNNTPENFRKALLMAKEYIDTHDLPSPLITLNSWNEWTETSYLEPDNINGYGYLEQVKDVFIEN